MEEIDAGEEDEDQKPACRRNRPHERRALILTLVELVWHCHCLITPALQRIHAVTRLIQLILFPFVTQPGFAITNVSDRVRSSRPSFGI